MEGNMKRAEKQMEGDGRKYEKAEKTNERRWKEI